MATSARCDFDHHPKHFPRLTAASANKQVNAEQNDAPLHTLTGGEERQVGRLLTVVRPQFRSLLMTAFSMTAYDQVKHMLMQTAPLHMLSDGDGRLSADRLMTTWLIA